MKCSFYLDRPYNPEIDSESLNKEIVSAREKKKNLAVKYFNPKPTLLQWHKKLIGLPKSLPALKI